MCTFHLTGRAFAFFLNMVNIFVLAACLLSSIAIKSRANALTLALSIQLTFDLVNWLQQCTRLSCELETYMISVNRCLEYTRLKAEGELKRYKEQKVKRSQVLPNLQLSKAAE